VASVVCFLQLNQDLSLDPVEHMADMVDRHEFVDLLKRMLELDQEQRITPLRALGHPFVLMTHLADFAGTKL
jgi:homeodomain interacting protein kinase